MGLGHGCLSLGISPHLVHKQPLATKQKQRDNEEIKERCDGGKIRKPRGLAVNSLPSRHWLAAGFRGAQRGAWRALRVARLDAQVMGLRADMLTP